MACGGDSQVCPSWQRRKMLCRRILGGNVRAYLSQHVNDSCFNAALTLMMSSYCDC